MRQSPTDDSPRAPLSPSELDRGMTEPPQSVLKILRACRGNCLVLGAAGKMGFHLSRMLQRALNQLGRNDRVIAVSRFSNEDVRRQFDEFSIDTITADLSHPQEIKAIPDAPNVFFLAGVKFGTSSQPELLQRMNHQMPLLVAERFKHSRLVAMSTGCVYSFSTVESGGSEEGGEMSPPGDYARSCIAREDAFIEKSLQHQTRCSIVRLNYSVEPRYGVLVDIARKVLHEQPIDLTTGYLNLIWQRDAITHIVQCLALATSPPFIVNITGSEILSVKDLAQRFSQRFKKDPIFNGKPKADCWLSDSSMARRKFGEPEMPIDVMIDWTAEWLLAGQETLSKPTHFQVRDGNY